MRNRTANRGRRTLAAAGIAACAVALSACGSSPPVTESATPATTAPPIVSSAPAPEPVPSPTPTPPPASPAPAASASYAPPADGAEVDEYLPGLTAQVRVPATQGPAPLIVMVPGGLWATSDPNGLAPLAARLTADGSTTTVLTYSTTATGSTFPVAVDEVACGIRWSVQQANDMGYPPTRVIVLGHSAGGQIASLIAYSGDEFGGDCPYDSVEVNGLIGIAGVYNTDWFTSGMSLWMGGVAPSDNPDIWRQANPILRVQDGTAPSGIRTLLIHGDADANVPLDNTTALADALRAAGMDVTATVFPGLEHMQVIEAGIAEPPIKTWMDSWPS